jgi:hypothetical protein
MEVNLMELQSKDLPKAQWRDMFKEKTPLSESDSKTMEDYFADFLPFNEKCVQCDSSLTGLFGSFRWGIVNGEGSCCVCGYPARAIHRNVGPIECTEVILQYHPSVLQENGDS